MNVEEEEKKDNSANSLNPFTLNKSLKKNSRSTFDVEA
jgi:hypothetical protein